MTPLGARTPHAHPALYVVVGFLSAVILAGAAWVFWPRSANAPLPSPSASASPVESPPSAAQGPAAWRPHTDTDAGFSLWYPATLERMTLRELPDQVAVSYVQYGGPVNEGGSFTLAVYDTPLTSIRTFYEGELPLSRFETVPVDGRIAYRYRDGDAGCGGTSYFIPLTPSSYAVLAAVSCEGDLVRVTNDLETMLGSFRFSATPGPMPEEDPKSGIPTSAWLPFSSQYFTLSFKVPPGFVVTDRPNAILISHGPLQEYEIGSDNAFFRLIRYTGSETKAGQLAAYRRALSYPAESQTEVDGIMFPTIAGTDIGRYEGTSAGSVVAIFFEKSWLEYLQPSPENPAFDAFTLGRYILSTFRFSK